MLDSFQGCYKDGTEPGTFDCRWFQLLYYPLDPYFFLLPTSQLFCDEFCLYSDHSDSLSDNHDQYSTFQD